MHRQQGIHANSPNGLSPTPSTEYTCATSCQENEDQQRHKNEKVVANRLLPLPLTIRIGIRSWQAQQHGNVVGYNANFRETVDKTPFKKKEERKKKKEKAREQEKEKGKVGKSS